MIRLLIWVFAMRMAATLLLLSLVAPAWAETPIIADVDTLILAGTVYQLDGIEGPQTDQTCLNEKREHWHCGIAARERLKEHVGDRQVRCEYVVRERPYLLRRVATCWIDGETMSLNQWLVREGWALNREPQARGRFKADQDDAQKNGRALWKGCFIAPQAYTNDRSAAIPMGQACTGNRVVAIKASIFPRRPAMPPGCAIKGSAAKRASLSGHRGIYHLERCRSYARTLPDRWFCSEDEARAEGFRLALTCRKP
jgi:endonuclease YncB( thermonuclease family)